MGTEGGRETAVVELQCSQDPGYPAFLIVAHFLPDGGTELLLEEVIHSSTLSQEVSDLVELIWAEALGHLGHTLLESMSTISLNDGTPRTLRGDELLRKPDSPIGVAQWLSVNL
ncbi:hypothetical protein QTO34_017100 [Cnephaeus nilssonii]|uniref:PARP4 WGR-like domain-containing protein n=1 Tax=Cnephaeus nilssonii TaxID=3371016 RepID=A0AA40LR57_CNENI|nr:hypothetical protein QTO34_017100 [Eptesicus nilssonii]